MCFSFDTYYYSDFPQYINWIEVAPTGHRDYLFDTIMYILSQFNNAEVTLRFFLLFFYATIILLYCKQNAILFVSSPLVLDIVFNSIRAGLALSLLTIFLFRRPTLNLLIFATLFFVHRYLSVILLPFQMIKKMNINKNKLLGIFILSAIAFFVAHEFDDKLMALKAIVYIFIDHGKDWEEFYAQTDTAISIQQKLTWFIKISLPSLIALLCMKRNDQSLIVVIVIATSVVLILSSAFPVVLRLSIIPYLLVTRITVNKYLPLGLMLGAISLSMLNLINDVDYLM